MARSRRAEFLIPLLLLATFAGIASAWGELPGDSPRGWGPHRGRSLAAAWEIRTPSQALDLAMNTLRPLRTVLAYTAQCPAQLGYVFGWRRNAIVLAKTAFARNRKGRARDLVNNAISRAMECQAILIRVKSPARRRLRSAIGSLRRALALIQAAIRSSHKPRPGPRPSPRPVPRPSPRPVPRPVPRPAPKPAPRPAPNSGGGSSGNVGPGSGSGDYPHALMLSFIYFEAQRSGSLPSSNRVKWRGNSGMKDGADNGADLTGGYYDAGDNVKFGLPGAFTVTMLAYGVVEFGAGYKGELGHALEAIRWGTDYLLKTWKPGQQRLYGQVGDGNADHSCWQRPEDCNENKQSFYVDAGKPGTELACETAAALAAAAMALRQSDPAYAQRCLTAAEQLWVFGTTHRGSYSYSISQVGGFYPSYSGYDDEILWSTAWLYRATQKASYASYINSFWTYGDVSDFSWDNKFAGSAILLASMSVRLGSPINKNVWLPRAESFICKYLPGGSIKKTPGGLSVVQYWSNLHYVTGALFLGAVHRKTMQGAGLSWISQCGKSPNDITSFVTGETKYILGNNPSGMSYMVGFGNKYPLKPHHRAASIPTPAGSYSLYDYSCQGGFKWFHSSDPNPHVLYGALVGGPGTGGDDFSDNRENYAMSEASIYNTASFTGVLAALQL